MRSHGRERLEARPVSIELSPIRHPEGSVSIRTGATWVICTATVEDRQPPFLRGTSRGWITAEYGMLPRSVKVRLPRDRVAGRGTEIERLIGRCLRSVVDLNGIPEQTVRIDCDVIDADGGTRTAAVTGGFVALALACRWMKREGRIRRIPIRDQVAGLGVGVVGGEVTCDLTHDEDAQAEVDMNIFLTGGGAYVAIHGDAEAAPFGGAALEGMLAAARTGLVPLFRSQRQALGLDPDAPFDAARLEEA